MDYCVVFITAPHGKEANRLTEILLAHKLCACVNIIKGIDSFFWWQGKIDRAQETLMILKTKKSLLPRLIKMVRGTHSYSVCEIIALPIVAGNKEYLKWIDDSCAKDKRKNKR